MTDDANHFTVTKPNGVILVEFADRKIIEELSISEIGDELSNLVDGQSGVKILLSFKNVGHLSSAALGMLITLNKKVTGQNGRLRLSDITPQIYEVFKITRLNKLFEIYDTAEQALAGF